MSLATQRNAPAQSSRPVQYRRFERLLVSADARAERHYDGYYLVLLFADLPPHFRLLPPGHSRAMSDSVPEEALDYDEIYRRGEHGLQRTAPCNDSA